MSAVRFLFDAMLKDSLVDALTQRDSEIETLCMGDIGAPDRSTPGPDILRFAEANNFTLITRDKRTMPGFINQHLASGHHTWGVFLLRRRFPINRFVTDLHLIWSASQLEEWRDSMDWLPWKEV